MSQGLLMHQVVPLHGLVFGSSKHINERRPLVQGLESRSPFKQQRERIRCNSPPRPRKQSFLDYPPISHFHTLRERFKIQRISQG